MSDLTRIVGTWSSARWCIVVSTLVALMAPVCAWFDVGGPSRVALVLVFWALVPGTPVAIAVFTPVRALWILMTPVISLSTAVVLLTTQLLANAWQPPLTMSIVALLHMAALPMAWRADSTRVASTPHHRRALALAAITLALAMAWWATRTVDLDAALGSGLLGVAPWNYWTALAILSAVAGWALSRPGLDVLVLSVSAVALVLVLYGFVALADGSPPVATTFVHLGVIDTIEVNDRLPQGVDARYSWPGFFLLVRGVLATAGVHDPVAGLVYYPWIANVLVLPAVLVIGRCVGGTARVGWLAVFVFIAGNWVQQDYFAPQSLAFLLATSVIAVLIWMRTEAPWDLAATRSGRWWWARRPFSTPARPRAWSSRRLVAVECLLLVVAAAVAVSHQLTPVALVLVAAALSATGLTRSRSWWLGAGAISAAWFTFGATDWWIGHLSDVFGGVGQVSSTVDRSVGDRSGADPVHQMMQQGRMAFTVLLWLLAGIGLLLVRRRPAAQAAAAAAVTPVLLVAAQSYGGEILLRVVLYSLPSVAALVAVMVHRVAGTGYRGLTIVTGSVLLGSFALTATRGANAAFERNPQDVVEISSQVLDESEPGDRIAPLRADGVLQMRRISGVDSPDPVECGAAVACLMLQAPRFIVVTTTREAYEVLRQGASPGTYSRNLVNGLVLSGRYERHLVGNHIIVLRRVDPMEVRR